ncbi:MAG: hypothetical protein HQK54_14155, partial [Oligoflexales bacterium]|nr:hypothetical protein [Oligoflexales bacterium]
FRMDDAGNKGTFKTFSDGVILDVVYRWQHDNGLYLDEFQMIQRSPFDVEVLASTRDDNLKLKVIGTLEHLQNLLLDSMEHPVKASAKIVNAFPPETGKRRVIKRAFNP